MISVGLVAANRRSPQEPLFLRSDAWFEDYWPNAPAEAVRAELRPGDRVFVPDRFSDWLLWKIPDLRGRIAYDVRFEVYDKEFFRRLADYNWERGPTGSPSRTATGSSSSTRRIARTQRTS